MKKLAFVETAQQLAAVPHGYAVIATHPRVTVEARLSGIEATRPEDYVSDAEIEALGLDNLGRVEELCRAIDVVAHPLVGDGVDVGSWSFFWLKILFDAVSLRAQYVARILDEETPAVVRAFQRVPRGTRPVPQDTSIYATVVGAAAADRGIAVELEPPLAGDGGAPDPRRSVRSLASDLRARSSLPTRNRRRDAPRVLCADVTYGISMIERELRALGVEVFRIPKPVFRSRDRRLGRDVWRAVESSADVRAAFDWNGLALWPAAAPHLRRLAEREFPAAAASHRRAARAFAKVRPDAVLTASATRPFEKAVCAAARVAAVPTVVSRHGGIGMRRLPMGAYVDLTDVALCWGRWEADWTEHHTGGAVETLVTGAPLVEEEAAAAPSRNEIRARLGIRLDEEIVLYLPTALSGNEWYAGRRAPSDGEYLRQQQQILSALVALGVGVLVKVHGGDDDPSPLGRWSEHAFGDRVRFLREPPYRALLHLAEAVVIDAPFTTLVEGVFGSAHLYVVDHPVIDWSPGVVDHLRSHGVRVCATSELGDQMRADRDAGRWARDPGYGPETREPLAAGGDGTAAQRAARAVAGIAARASRR